MSLTPFSGAQRGGSEMPKRKRLTQKERKAVYEKYDGHCAYCGCELELKDMQVDHIESIRRHEIDDVLGIEDICDKWINTLENLNPSCRMCNFYKGTMEIEGLREQLGHLIGRLEKIYIFRLALKYGLISVNKKQIRFYFEGRRAE